MQRKVPLDMIASHDLVQKMIAAGKEFSIDKGGTMDARLLAINFWCIQEDHPKCWPAIEGGTVLADYVSMLFWSYNPQLKSNGLFLELSPYALVKVKSIGTPHRDWDVITKEEWADIEEWSRIQVWKLIRQAQIREAVVGTKCPLCDYVHPVAQSGLVDHIVEKHGKVQRICLGEDTQVQVEGVFHTLQDQIGE